MGMSSLSAHCSFPEYIHPVYQFNLDIGVAFVMDKMPMLGLCGQERFYSNHRTYVRLSTGYLSKSSLLYVHYWMLVLGSDEIALFHRVSPFTKVRFRLCDSCS